MKESWCLASSRADLKPSEVVNLYGRRFTIEERFRDIKDWRFGMVSLRFRWSLLSDGIGCPLSSCLRRPCFTFWGRRRSAGNVATPQSQHRQTRVHSLYRQGQTYLQLLPSMRNPVRKAPPPFPRITASARQNLKTSRPTVANVPSRKFEGIGQGGHNVHAKTAKRRSIFEHSTSDSS